MQLANRAAVFLILFVGILSPHSPAQAPRTDIATANKLFQAGKFVEARNIYFQIAAKNPADFSAALHLGHIALLANQLDDAQRWLQKALNLQRDDREAKIMLAEVFYRRDQFPQAAAMLSGLGPPDADMLKSYATLNVTKLQSFQDQTPYELEGPGDITRLKFVKTDPLPLVHVRINDGPEVIFFIDTGDSELLLDTEFAREIGIKPLGAVQGTFSGGQHADVENGKINSLTLGDWTVKNVPVGMLPLRSLSESFGIKQLNGCVGTNVLYHFLSTIDYPAGELVLRRNTAANRKQFDGVATKRNVVVPFWMAGDHFMVAWGQVQTIPPALFFVDTGLAGAGVKFADSMIKQAGIKLEEDKASVGEGGGGQLKVIPFVVRDFSLGAIKEQNVEGLYDGPFPWENAWGFYVAGMAGHDFFKPYAVTLDFTRMRIILR